MRDEVHILVNCPIDTSLTKGETAQSDWLTGPELLGDVIASENQFDSVQDRIVDQAQHFNALWGSRKHLGVLNIFKSKCLVFAHFWSDFDEIFMTGVKLHIFFEKKYFFHQI